MTWINKNFEYGLEPTDKSFVIKDAHDLNEYVRNVFKMNKETTFLNENSSKLWFWKNVGLLFSTGVIFRNTDVVELNEYLSYFDSDQNTFLPIKYKITNYKDPEIQALEKMYNLGNGNYHILMIPFVYATDPIELEKAPESGYSKTGPVDTFLTQEEITNYMLEINYKYGCIKSELSEPKQSAPNGAFGIKRTIEPSTENPYLHGANTKRINRKGYIDLNTNDAYELINPEQDLFKFAPQRQYFDENDQGPFYRTQNKTIPRDGKYTDNSQTWQGRRVKRTEGKHSLYNELINQRKYPQTTMLMPSGKGAIYKVNQYYETLQNQEEKPNYELYDCSVSDPQFTDLDKFIEEVKNRDRIQVMTVNDRKKIENAGLKHEKFQPRAEQSGIFSIKPNHK